GAGEVRGRLRVTADFVTVIYEHSFLVRRGPGPRSVVCSPRTTPRGGAGPDGASEPIRARARAPRPSRHRGTPATAGAGAGANRGPGRTGAIRPPSPSALRPS